MQLADFMRGICACCTLLDRYMCVFHLTKGLTGKEVLFEGYVSSIKPYDDQSRDKSS